MDPSTDPLRTRSLPGHLWEKVPEDWQILDKNLQALFENSILQNQSPWRELRWLTEDAVGISILGVLLLALFLWSHRDSLPRNFARIPRTRSLAGFFLFLLGMGLSDLTAMRLKIFFGRLKPHVNFYHPDYLPALSLPSNHAFNSAFLFSLLYCLQKKPLLGSQRAFYILLFVSVLLVGISRIAFGQHYPLDVFCGWLLGTGFGALYSHFLRWAKERIAPHSRSMPKSFV
jgi:membrane-associated phospholipid phosphatase